MLTYITQKNNTLNDELTVEVKQQLNILVVDDDEMSRHLFPSLLSKLGYTCKTAKNGQEAINILQNENFDIIFMDLSMPIMDGIETTQQIRSTSQNPQKPVIIALTANAWEEEKERCLAAGMNDFMIKPYRLVAMEQILNNWAAIIKQ